MAALLESDVKRALALHGITVPFGQACTTADQASEVAEQCGGRAVVKALVPAKGKQRAGAVTFVETPGAAAEAARSLLGTCIAGFPVQEVLVERRERLETELYAAVELDAQSRGYRLTIAANGGDGVEAVLATGAAQSLHFRPHGIPFVHQARDLLIAAGVKGGALRQVPETIVALCRAALDSDMTLLEVNPLAIREDGTTCVIGVLATLDESAFSRQPMLAARAIPYVEQLLRPRTEWERAVDALDEVLPDGGDIRFGEFPGGDIGMMVLGGGAGLIALDAVARAGGKPANFLDMTSASSPQTEEKVYRLTRLFLERENLRGLFIGSNIGAFLPVPVRMRAVARAVSESPRVRAGFPVVARLAGIADNEVSSIIAGLPITYFRDEVTLEEAGDTFMQKLAARG